MGHQSYILLVKDEAEHERIMSVIQAHNSYWDTLTEEQKKDPQYDLVGEDLEYLVKTNLLKSKPKKYAEYQWAILCGNGGGRSNTFNWFWKHNVMFEPFQRQKWLSTKTSKIVQDRKCATCRCSITTNERECDKCFDERYWREVNIRMKWIEDYNNSLPQEVINGEFGEMTIAIGGIYDGEAELYQFDNVPSPRIIAELEKNKKKVVRKILKIVE
jgi:hypothetical protein